MELDYKQLFEFSPGCCLILETDFTIVAVTNAYLAVTMTKRENILGRNLFDVFPDNPEDIQADGESNLKISLNRVIQNKTADTMAVQKYDIRKPKSEGGQFEVRYWSPVNLPVLSVNGEVILIIHRVEDVTEFVLLEQKEKEQNETNLQLRSRFTEMEIEILLRNKEIKNANTSLEKLNTSLQQKTEELKRSNDDLSRFAAIASHDIKAPIRSVAGYLEIVKDKIGNLNNNPELKEAFIKITSARERINILLDDLLKFSQVTQLQQPLTQVDLNKVIEDVLKNMDFSIKDKNATVIIKEKLPEVKGYYFLLGQLFQNLISNAIKFQNKKEPEVIISFTKTKDYYQFSVKDNGIGIDRGYFEKIFKAFERLHAQTEYPGSGLGLAICQRIVERHEGKIWVESEISKGTTFYFTLSAIN